MKLIGLLVLLGLVSLVEGEVVNSFASPCAQFFIKDQNNGFFSGFFNFFMNNNNPVTPTVLHDQNRYKQICQKYKNMYRYATLYDTHNRIPVYSAYLYTGYTQLARRTTWMIEPELDGLNGKDMATEAKAGGPLGSHQAVNEDYLGHNCDQDQSDLTNSTPQTGSDNKQRFHQLNGYCGKEHQAVNENYSHSYYQKGHLYPHCQNCNQNQAESTFTLTNAAPQTQNDNTRWFNQVENIVKKDIGGKCGQNSAHVVTGVIPGNTYIERRINNVVVLRVNIPSHFWSAFCCRDNQNIFISKGFMLKMEGDGTATASEERLAQLNQELGRMYGQAFQVFGSVTGCS